MSQTIIETLFFAFQSYHEKSQKKAVCIIKASKRSSEQFWRTFTRERETAVVYIKKTKEQKG
jgi:hypothetical protein